MTGNIGAALKDKASSFGFDQTGSSSTSNKILDEAKNALSTEFVNRIDDVVVFNNFEFRNIQEMLYREVGLLTKKVLSEHSIELKTDTDALDFLAKKAYDENMGARPVRKIVEQNIENILSEEILKNENKKIHLKVTDFS